MDGELQHSDGELQHTGWVKINARTAAGRCRNIFGQNISYQLLDTNLTVLAKELNKSRQLKSRQWCPVLYCLETEQTTRIISYFLQNYGNHSSQTPPCSRNWVLLIWDSKSAVQSNLSSFKQAQNKSYSTYFSATGALGTEN